MDELVSRERLIKELTEAISRRNPAFTKEENNLITTGLRLAIKIVNLSPAADVPETISRQQEMIDGLIAGQETLQKVIAEKNRCIENLELELKINK